MFGYKFYTSRSYGRYLASSAGRLGLDLINQLDLPDTKSVVVESVCFSSWVMATLNLDRAESLDHMILLTYPLLDNIMTSEFIFTHGFSRPDDMLNKRFQEYYDLYRKGTSWPMNLCVHYLRHALGDEPGDMTMMQASIIYGETVKAFAQSKGKTIILW